MPYHSKAILGAPIWFVCLAVQRSVGRLSWSSSLGVGRSVGQSVGWWSGAVPHSGGGVGLCPTLGGPHERGRNARLHKQPPKPHTPRPQLLARNRPRSWGGARWGATSAWCALGNLRDFGGGLAASDVAKVRKELPARRLAAAQCLRALRVSQVAWHPATATQRWLARKLLEKPL